MALIDLTGKRFGRWLVLEKAPPRPGKCAYWLCKCDCGTVAEVASNSLRKGTSTSCGCWRKEWAGAKRLTHGMWGSRLYRIWNHMIDRCCRPNSTNYINYGGRGIEVCEEWKDFLNFAEWALNNGYEDNLTLDRIDNDGMYCPANCRWADRITQANNKRNNHHICINGESKTIAEWARQGNICPSTISHRIHCGMDETEAVIMPNRRHP